MENGDAPDEVSGTTATIKRVGSRVVVAERQELVRSGLSAMLRSLSSVREIEPCSCPFTAISMLADRTFDVLIISSDLEGFEIEQLAAAAAAKEVRMLLLLRSSEPSCLKQTAMLPINGFLLESDLTIESLQDALEQLSRGEMPIPRALARQLLRRFRSSNGSVERPPLLTPREHEALNLLVEGLSNKQIARRLGISEHGAKRHVANVLAKLNCPNRTLAVATAIKDGLVTGPSPAQSGDAGGT